MARGLFNLFLRIFEAVGTISLAISGREREIEGTIIGTFAFKLRATLMSRIAMATIVYKQKPKMVILASKNSNKINTKRVFFCVKLRKEVIEKLKVFFILAAEDRIKSNTNLDFGLTVETQEIASHEEICSLTGGNWTICALRIDGGRKLSQKEKSNNDFKTTSKTGK